jgi:hypothetical protein
MQDDGGLAVFGQQFVVGCSRLFGANFSSVAVLLTGSLPRPFFTSEDQLPTANCQLQTANRKLPTANCQLPTANCQLPTANCQLPTANR